MIIVFPIILLALLVAIAIIDFRTYTIPDILNAALAITGVAASLSGNWISPEQAIIGAIAGFGLTFSLRAGYKYWRGFHGLGLGDVKLAGAGGFWIGLEAIPLMMLIAALAGILASLAKRKFRLNAVDRHDRIAFGPWLALGIGIAWVLNIDGLDHLFFGAF